MEMQVIDVEDIFSFNKNFVDLNIEDGVFKNLKYKKIRFKSSILTEYEENNYVYGYIFYPKKEFNGINIIAIHPVHESVPAFEYACAFYFTRYGYKVSYISLPYHRERTPKGTKCGELFFSNDDEEYFLSMRQSIVDLRQFIYFLNAYEKDDNFYAIGLSLGAILLHLLMGIDKNIKKGVSIMGGGNILRLTWEGLYGVSSRIYYKKIGFNFNSYKKELKEYLKYVDEVKEKGKIIKGEKLWYLVDPLTYSSFNNPRNVILINGLFDLVITRKSVLELWERIGKPRLIWIPSTHYMIPVFFPYVLYLSNKFFKK